jgi:hypothetical protein
MGQMLSRDDDDAQQDQHQCLEQQQDHFEQEHLEEKPKRKQRNVRSRRTKSSVQGRTRRKTVSFD